MAPADRDALLKSIAATIADYRSGEITPPDPSHVNRWVSQFDAAAQLPMLGELDHVLAQSYFSRAKVEAFLKGLARNPKLTGANPCEFWKNAGLLSIQRGGRSQADMLGMFDGILKGECGLSVCDCTTASGNFVYIDDALFSGNRLKIDLISWLKDAPSETPLSVIVIASHTGCIPYVRGAALKAARDMGKKIDIAFWRCVEIENRLAQRNRSEVLWPSRIPNDERTQAYAEMLSRAGHPPQLRLAGAMGSNRFFSSEEGRDVLEQELLKAGAKIRSESPNLNEYQRPLGNMVLQTLGFGALIVTFRNCANSCPLAFWASDPWYPLFPRKTN